MSLVDSREQGGTPAALLDPMLPRRFRIGRTRQDTRDTYTLELEPVEGSPLAYLA